MKHLAGDRVKSKQNNTICICAVCVQVTLTRGQLCSASISDPPEL